MTRYGTLSPQVMEPEPERRPVRLAEIMIKGTIYFIEYDNEDWIYIKKQGAKKYLRVRYEDRYNLMLSKFIDQLEEINA